MVTSPFNDYDETGFRINQNNCRTSKIEDEAIIYNLRFRWRNELTEFSDTTLLNAYDDFACSEFFGNNDEAFLEWMDHYK